MLDVNCLRQVATLGIMPSRIEVLRGDAMSPRDVFVLPGTPCDGGHNQTLSQVTTMSSGESTAVVPTESGDRVAHGHERAVGRTAPR